MSFVSSVFIHSHLSPGAQCSWLASHTPFLIETELQMGRSRCLYSLPFPLPSTLLKSPDIEETPVETKELILLQVAPLLGIRKIPTLPPPPLSPPHTMYFHTRPLCPNSQHLSDSPCSNFNSASLLQMLKESIH